VPRGSTKKSRAEVDALLARVNEKYHVEGSVKPVAARASDLQPITYIPCASPTLGYLMGHGGWPSGKLVEFFGDEGLGKSTLLAFSLYDCYTFHNKQKPIAVVDIEHKYNWERAIEILGMPEEEFILMQPEDAETAADMMRDLIRSRQFAAVGYDSIGSATPAYMMEAFADNATRHGGVAAVMSRTMGMVVPDANLFDTTVFFVNQMRGDMTGKTPVKDRTPGGTKPKFQMAVRIHVRQSDPWKIKGQDAEGKSADIEVGYRMHFRVVKNSYGPNERKGWSDIYYTPTSEYLDRVGFDTDGDYMRLALALNVVEKSGAWLNFGDVQAQGRTKFFELVDKAGKRDELYAAVRAKMSQGPKSLYDESQPEPEEPEEG
jgi:recombination protein RecA